MLRKELHKFQNQQDKQQISAAAIGFAGYEEASSSSQKNHFHVWLFPSSPKLKLFKTTTPVCCETKKSLLQPPASSFTVLKSCCHETNVARFFFFFYMHLKAQVQQQLIFDGDFTETTQCVSTKTNYRAIFTGESKVWSITVIRMPQHEQLLNQCSPAWAWCKILLCVGAPLPKALSITLIFYYLFHPSPGQDWESLLSQAVTTAFVSFLSAAVQWLLLL